MTTHSKTLEERRVEAQAESQRKLEAAFEGLKEALTKRGLSFKSVKFSTWRNSLSIGDHGITAEVKLELGKSNSWNPQVSKVRITVDDHRHKRQFPERKNGFDFEAICDEICARTERAIVAKAHDTRHQAIRAGLEDQVQRIQTIVGTVPNTNLRVLHSSGLNIEVHSLSEDQALQVMQLLQTFHSKGK